MTMQRAARLLACLFVISLLGSPHLASSDAPRILIRLQAGQFDPLRGEPSLPNGLRATVGPAPAAYLVQLTGPIRSTWRDALEEAGARLLGYVPDLAFLAWMDGPTRDRVAELPMVRWVGPYHPAYKLSPDLEEYSGPVRVELFPVEEEPLGALAQASGLGLAPSVVTTTTLALSLDQTQLASVAAWPEVVWIQPQRLPQLHNDQAARIIGAPSLWQRGYVGEGQMVAFADSGLDTGVDGSQVGDIHPDLDNRVDAIASWPVADWNYGGCWAANQGADDGAADLSSGHGTHVVGTAAGNGAASNGTYEGMAPQSSIAFQALEQWTDWEGPDCFSLGLTDGYYLTGIPASLRLLFSQAYGTPDPEDPWKARIHSNSWGYASNGAYTAEAYDVDRFVWDRPLMTIIFSAGNNGCDGTFDPLASQRCSGEADGYVDEDSLDYPASAKNAIAVGASESWRPVPCPNSSCKTWGDFFLNSFPAEPTRTDLTADSKDHVAAISSRGPVGQETGDPSVDKIGRIKPDLVAPGTWIASVRARWASDPGLGQPIDEYYKYNFGTSMAAAVVAGAVADLREFYTEELLVSNPSAALLKATLLNSALDLQGYGNPLQEAGQPTPNNHEGWGRLNLTGATSSQLAYWDPISVSTGDSVTKTRYIGNSQVPMRVTLVWSDYPKTLPVSFPDLVNDLDLEVIAPDGTRYRGNAGLYTSGPCLRDGLWDQCNNVERVAIDNPQPGSYKFVVHGYNIPQPLQPSALVAKAGFGFGWSYSTYLPLLTTAPPEPAPCP
jgi:subtilisin family serine protease